MLIHRAWTIFVLLSLVGNFGRGQVPLANPALVSSGQVNYWQGYQGQAVYVDRMYVDIGTIGLVREVPDSQVIAVDALGDEILNADKLQGSMQFGTKAMVGFRDVKPWFGGTDLQLGYFGINSLDGDARVNSTQVYSVFFKAYPLNPPPSFDFTYSTNLYSGEANLLFGSRNQFRPIVGLRYFKLEDTYDVFNSTDTTRTGFYSLTNNSLFGGQLGLEGDLWQGRRVSLYGFGKVAAMNNDVEGTATAANGFKNYSDSTYTTLVDAGTGANIRVAGPLSFRVGYRSLFASALALGIDQNEAIAIYPSGPSSVKYNSQHWHGIDIAAVFVF